MIYNSQNYCVVEFAGPGEGHAGGYEIMDKTHRRGIFVAGVLADGIRSWIANAAATQPSVDEIDTYLSRFDSLMQQPLSLH